MRKRSLSALALPALLSTLTAPSLPAQKLDIGSDAPALAVKWIKGEPLDLAKSKDTIVVVECWATWCGPCIGSIPHISALQKRFVDKNVRVVGVAVMDELGKVEKFVAAKGDAMGYTVAFDGEGAVAKGYLQAAEERGIPCSFVIDKEKKIAWIGHPMAGLDKVIERLVAGKYDREAARLERTLTASAMEATAKKDWKKLAQIAHEMVEKCPNTASTWSMKLFVAKKIDEASLSKTVEKALEVLAPYPQELALFAGQVLLSGEYGKDLASKALPAVEAALAKSEGDPDLHLARVRILAAGGKQEEAKKAADATLKVVKDPAKLQELAEHLAGSEHADAFADVALKALDGAGGGTPSVELLEIKFRVLDHAKHDQKAAAEVGKQIVAKHKGDADALNSFAWNLLTEDDTKGRYTELALSAAEAMQQCEGWDAAHRIDTVALAKFESGKVDEAIKLQKQAIEKAGDNAAEYQERLERYEAAKKEAGKKEAGKQPAPAERKDNERKDK